MATTFTNKKGYKVTLLSPKERGNKFATEIKYGYAKMNNGQSRRDDKGKGIKLTKEQLSYRAGYLDARKDIGKAFASRKKKS